MDKCYDCGGRVVLNTRPRVEKYFGVEFKLPAVIAIPQCINCGEELYSEVSCYKVDDLCKRAVASAPKSVRDLIEKNRAALGNIHS